ncbi:recombinase family protein [Ochrobactrum sp. A-1]|uniref:recombinase family protein n=1 Tax=Ochrobactrum sp. A-1 TaxID=2920940 RepID=UPI0040465F01
MQRAGCEKTFEEKKSGKAGTNRPALAYLRPEAFLVVWKLDCLGRSLVEMMRTLDERRRDGVKFRASPSNSTARLPMAASPCRCMARWPSIFLELYRERPMEGLKTASSLQDARTRECYGPPRIHLEGNS